MSKRKALFGPGVSTAVPSQLVCWPNPFLVRGPQYPLLVCWPTL
jgi:hypothetical protein